MPSLAETPSSPRSANGALQEHFRQSLAIGAATLLASRMAVQRLSLPKLKRFAELETAEQEALADVLGALADRDASQGSGVGPEDLERRLAPDGRKAVDQVRAADGTALARAYFLLQLTAHQQLLNAHESYLKNRTDPAAIRATKLADALVREHLQLLMEIKSDIDSGKGATRRGR
jgi:predicted outer membrane protein